jgi:hypothetical protein
MSEWISIKDRLPEIGEHVLFTNGRYRDLGFRTQKNVLYCVSASMMKSIPTHWMPLPKPPETE